MSAVTWFNGLFVFGWQRRHISSLSLIQIHACGHRNTDLFIYTSSLFYTAPTSLSLSLTQTEGTEKAKMRQRTWEKTHTPCCRQCQAALDLTTWPRYTKLIKKSGAKTYTNIHFVARLCTCVSWIYIRSSSAERSRPWQELYRGTCLDSTTYWSWEWSTLPSHAKQNSPRLTCCAGIPV